MFIPPKYISSLTVRGVLGRRARLESLPSFSDMAAHASEVAIPSPIITEQVFRVILRLEKFPFDFQEWSSLSSPAYHSPVRFCALCQNVSQFVYRSGILVIRQVSADVYSNTYLLECEVSEYDMQEGLLYEASWNDFAQMLRGYARDTRTFGYEDDYKIIPPGYDLLCSPVGGNAVVRVVENNSDLHLLFDTFAFRVLRGFEKAVDGEAFNFIGREKADLFISGTDAFSFLFKKVSEGKDYFIRDTADGPPSSLRYRYLYRLIPQQNLGALPPRGVKLRRLISLDE